MNTAETPKEVTRPRLVGLDLLRLLAILLVLGRHIVVGKEKVHLEPFLMIWNRGGWIGVDLFFVLSGFLISGLIFTEYKKYGRFSIGRFYLRRGWKIYPPFFTLMATTVIAGLTFDPSIAITKQSILSEVLFLQSYRHGVWNHTWSLAVEEHFYLLLPLLLTIMLRFNRDAVSPFRPILKLMAIVAVSVLMLRIFNWYDRYNYQHLTHLFPTHLRIDSLLFGVAISYLYHFHTAQFITRLAPWRWWLIVSGAFFLSPAFFFELSTTPMIYTIGLTIFYIGSGMIVVGVLLCEIPPTRLILVASLLGSYSYSIYLWHMPVLHWLLPVIERNWKIGIPLHASIFLVASLLIGMGMAKLIELPALRLRDRWFPARSSGPLEQNPQLSAPVVL